jgi:hemoglobin
MTPRTLIPERDLQEEDLHELLMDFYASVSKDSLLASYFEAVDMPSHMPRIVDFWSTLVFHSGRYTGNAFRPHLAMLGLTAAHFARWLETLDMTLDAHFAGDRTEQMKDFGHRVAFSMQLRLGIAPLASYQSSPSAPIPLRLSLPLDRDP